MRKSRRIAGTVRTRTCCQRNYDNGKSATFVAPAGYARSWGRNISKPMPQVRCVGMDDAHRVGSPANCHHLRCSGRSSCLYRSCERRQHGCASHQSNGSRQRLRRVQRRAVLSVIVPGSARSKVRAFGTKSRRDAHYGVTDQSDQQPEANFRKRPCHHESRYEGQFERGVSRYPELPSRYPTAQARARPLALLFAGQFLDRRLDRRRGLVITLPCLSSGEQRWHSAHGVALRIEIAFHLRPGQRHRNGGSVTRPRR